VTYARIRPLVKAPDRQHLRDTMLVLRHLLALRPEMTEQRRALLRLYADYGYASEAVVTTGVGGDVYVNVPQISPMAVDGFAAA